MNKNYNIFSILIYCFHTLYRGDHQSMLSLHITFLLTNRFWSSFNRSVPELLHHFNDYNVRNIILQQYTPLFYQSCIDKHLYCLLSFAIIFLQWISLHRHEFWTWPITKSFDTLSWSKNVTIRKLDHAELSLKGY